MAWRLLLWHVMKLSLFLTRLFIELEPLGKRRKYCYLPHVIGFGGGRRSNSYWDGSVCLHRQAKIGDWGKLMTDLREYVLKV